MTSTLQEMTKEMQTRIRELAYLMWESAGRQHGMAMEYWLKAESEVISTLQAAASRMIPGTTAAPLEVKATETAPPAQPQPAVAAPAPVPASASEQTEVVADASSGSAPQGKPAARKPASRAKKV